jgi:hypothetical protein
MRRFARIGLVAAGLAAYGAAVLEHPEPLVMALGLAPIAWIALEAFWRLTKD